MSTPKVPLVSRYTFSLHARAALLEGVMTGVIVTNDFVARKTLGATPFQLVLLTMVPPATWLLAPFFAEHVARARRKPLFAWAGLLGRLPMLAVAVVGGPWGFLAVLTANWFVNTALIPAQNVLFQKNYDQTTRGHLYGRAMVFQWAAQAAVSMAAGWLLDQNAQSYRWLYPAAGVAGFISCLVFGRVRLRHRDREARRDATVPHPPVWTLLKETLGRNRGFRRFETGLFLYGMGFMSMMPVFALLFHDELHMSHQEAFFAKSVVFAVVNILALGLAGALHDRIGLEKLTAVSCLGLMLFAISMALVTTPFQAIAGFALFGLSMAGIGIAWQLASVRYAPPGGAGRYMSVHMFLVGLRAVIGHPLGAWIYVKTGSTRATFWTAAGFFLLATLLMVRAARIDRREASARAGD